MGWGSRLYANMNSPRHYMGFGDHIWYCQIMVSVTLVENMVTIKFKMVIGFW